MLMALPKINRIRKKKDFEIIFKNSRSFKTSLCILRIAKNELGVNRFGFVVSLKVSKNAVVRNKIRRRFAEVAARAIKNITPTAQANTGTDVVLIALPGIEKKEFLEIKQVINNALIKMGLIFK